MTFLIAALAFTACARAPNVSRPLLFQAQPPGESEDIYTFELGVGKVGRVTRGGADYANSFPAWSPDGQRIAFVRQSAFDALFVLSVSTGTLRQVRTPDFPLLGPPAWSPDGGGILIAAGQEAAGKRLYRVNVDDPGFSELPLPLGTIDCGTYSPDGSRIVATRRTPEQSEVIIFDLLTSESDILLASGSNIYHCPEWSPAGERIGVTVYSEDYSQAALALIDLTGTTQLIAAGSAYYNAFKWSPDASWIAFQCTDFSGTPNDPAFYRHMEVCVIRPDGSGLRRLTQNDYFDAHPSW